MEDAKRTRRQFTSEDKAAAVKRHVVGGEAVSVVCDDLGIAPNLFYRWLTYMMMDADIVAVSPSTVYRALKREGLLGRRDVKPSKKSRASYSPCARIRSGTLT